MVEKVEKTENNKKIIWIQNLRAIASMLIILLHVVDGWIISNNYILFSDLICFSICFMVNPSCLRL